jgi:ubiquinol-cytochrome c reductase cytochrome c1 subunit
LDAAGRARARDRSAYGQGWHASLEYKWTQISPGAQNTVQYDATVRDLVNFLVYVGEPAAQSRKHIGRRAVRAVDSVRARVRPEEGYWKDVH